VIVAHDKGMLDPYLAEGGAHQQLLEAVLWAVKLNGCAVSEEEIRVVMRSKPRAAPKNI